MNIAYFDCFAGASGNMILGAFVDAGLPLESLERELRKLPVSGWTMRAEAVTKRGIGATYIDVQVPGEDHDHSSLRSSRSAKADRSKLRAADRSKSKSGDRHKAHRKLADILDILRAARFAPDVEKTARAMYVRLGEAEARVHRMPVEDIAFHEVGQIDAIVDIAGAALALHLLGIDEVYCSPLPSGGGSIHSAHGRLPSPPPAVVELLRDKPTYRVEVDGELVTPTGAAILSTIANFDVGPPTIVRRVGYGAGRSDFPFANVLRVSIGERSAAGAYDGSSAESVAQLETNIDDMNPQLFDHVVERMYAEGALDVWMQPAHMKKGRLGTIVSALAPHERVNALAAVLLAETTTIGVRRWTAQRVTLRRSIESVDTSLGPVRVKVVEAPSGARARPEYDDCKAIARARGIALADVMRAVEREVDAWLTRRG